MLLRPIVVMRRFALGLVLVGALLGACNHGDTESRITVVFNHAGEVVEPPVPGVPARWSHSAARQAVTDEFRDGTTHVWFGSYQGQPAWLAITDGIPIAHGPVPTERGYTFGVYADGETPLRLLSGQVEAPGKPPPVNDAPPRRNYDGRLHVTFVIPGNGPIAASPGKWMVEPAPATTKPALSRAEAESRARAAGVNLVDAKTVRVYFGLFTGLDIPGALHAKTPGWLAVGTHVRVNSQGPGTAPQFAYGVTAFSDDLTQPWVSGRRLLTDRPFVY